MSTKKGKSKSNSKNKSKDKSKDKKKDGPPKLSNVEETFYQLDVADREKKIANLRKHLQDIDTRNEETKEKMRSLNEDKIDKAADLTREYQSDLQTSIILKEKVFILNKEYEEKKSKDDITISELEDKHKAMHDQLTSKIKHLKSRIKILEEFSQQIDAINLRNEDEEELLNLKTEEYNEKIEDMERKIKTQRDAIRKDAISSLLKVSTNFTSLTASRNASYSQRLTRENIALTKEINMLEFSLQSMYQEQEARKECHKAIILKLPKMNQKKRELIQIAQQKTNIIESLTTKYEKLKSAYTESLLYKNQYHELVEYQLCSHHHQRRLMEQVKLMGTKAHDIKNEYNKMQKQYEQNEHEIRHLYNIIVLIQQTIQHYLKIDQDIINSGNAKLTQSASEINQNEMSISEDHDNTYSSEEEEESGEEEEEHNINLIEDLLKFLKSHFSVDDFEVSLKTISSFSGILHHSDLRQPSSASLRDRFKYSISDDLESIHSEVLHPGQPDSKKIPKEVIERQLLIDVEDGTTLYVSSSAGNPDVISFIDNDFDDYQVSSSSFDSLDEQSDEKAKTMASETTLQPAGSKTALMINKLPPGTIVDVELQEEAQDEMDVEALYYLEQENDESVQEEDEMSILFF